MVVKCLFLSDCKLQVAVCNLASIAVNMFVEPDKTYNFDKLKKVAKVATKNLNKIIDVNYYPVKEARNSNMRHRPIGIGIQVEVLPNVLRDLKFGMELFGHLKILSLLFLRRIIAGWKKLRNHCITIFYGICNDDVMSKAVFINSLIHPSTISSVKTDGKRFDFCQIM